MNVKISGVALMVTTVLLPMLLPTAGLACVCAPELESFGHTVPSDGATDVPLNVVPWLRFASNGLVWFDEHGATVEFEPRFSSPGAPVCYGSAELFPRRALEPNTTYYVGQLEQSALDGDVDGDVDAGGDFFENLAHYVAFTTGDAILTASPAQIELRFALIDGKPYAGGCTPAQYYACADTGLPADDLLEVAVFAGEEERNRYVRMAEQADPIIVGNADVDCVELRGRDLVGQRGPVTRTCFDTVGAPTLGGEIVYPDCSGDFEQRLVHSNLDVERDGGTSAPFDPEKSDVHAGNAAPHVQSVDERDSGCALGAGVLVRADRRVTSLLGLLVLLGARVLRRRV